MMERTGNSVIDAMIVGYLKTSYAQELSDPQMSYGKCVGASNDFIRWLEDSELPYEATIGSGAPEIFGYADRPVQGCTTHHVVVIVGSDYQYMVDFTANQYGYSEHPMVQRRNGEGHWVRRW